MTIVHNKVELDQAMQDENDEEQEEEEERVYVAGQILAGNLDKELPTNSTSYADKDGPASGQPDLGEQRGRAVLAIFNLADNKGNALSSSNNPECDDESWAESATTLLTAHKDPLSIPSNAKSKTKTELMWKMLRQPILSMAHVGIANGLVDRALKCDSVPIQTSMYSVAKAHLQSALHLWMCNPSAMLAMANLTRMGVVPIMVDSSQTDQTHPTDDASVRQRMQLAMHQYVAAAKCATSVRLHAINLMVGPNKLKSTDDLFLVETIVLGLAAQVEALEDNIDDDKININNNTNNDDDDDDEYGQSKVVSTASYMAALLASTLGHHNVAKEALAAFGNNVTRIHPGVWDAAAHLAKHSDRSDETTKGVVSACPATAGAFTPSIFRKAIPNHLANILRHAFRPDAPYWDQSGYDRGVYYSFWHDYHRPSNNEKDTTTTPTMTVAANAVEEVITSYLLPRVKHVVGEQALSELAGFEWWVHTRPHGANLGHQLHFDTDEALLEQDRIVSFPICATVLYLNGGDEEEADNNHDDDDHDDDDNDHSNHHFGATVLFDQTPYCKKNADRAWISTPRPRSFLVFPGDLLHGVLPCAPVGGDSATTTNKGTKDNNKRKRALISEADGTEPLSSPSTDKAKEQKVEPQPHRLTFMVNFWARNIPEKLKKRKLYGPSGPFPPTTRRHSWTNDLLDGGVYPRTLNPSPSSPGSRMESSSDATQLFQGTLACIEPAWELLNVEKSTNSHQSHDSESNHLTKVSAVDLPPSGINQRFFVKNAPDFFHSTLFEK